MLGGRQISVLGAGILLKIAEMLRKKSNVIRLEGTSITRLVEKEGAKLGYFFEMSVYRIKAYAIMNRDRRDQDVVPRNRDP